MALNTQAVEGLSSIEVSKCRSHNRVKRVTQSEMKRTTCFIRQDLYKRLKHMATDKDITVTDLINEGVENILKKYDK